MPVGMSSQIMSYLYMGLAAFMVIFALFGLINGFRKSIYRLITFAVFIVLLLLFGGVFTNTLINTDISQYLDQFNITLPEGATGGTIRDIVGSLLESNLGSAATTELRDAVLAIVSLACMVIYFVFMMTVVRWFYLIVTWIIWLFIKPKRRKKEDLVTVSDGDGEEEVKGDVHIKKRGKRRLLGMGVGAAKGLICYFLLVTVLLTGPLSVVPNLDEFFTNEEPSTSENLADELVTTTSQGIPINVDGQTWTEIKNFVSSYKKSPFYVVAGGDSKGFSINSMVNDNIWKGSYGKYSISLRKEIGALTDVAASAMKLFGKVDGSNVEVDHETFVSLSEVIEGLSNSEYLMSVLPVLTDSFFNHEKVKEVLPEDFDLEGLKKIEWKKDFQTLAQTVLDLESIADWKDITGLKFENFQKEGVTNFFKGLSELTFLSYTLDGVVKFALELEPVKENIGELELEIDDLVWSEEINQLGNIVNAFLDVGIKSFDEVKGLEIFDKISLPGLREFTKALFGVKLVDRLFPEIMSKVVLKSIKDEDVRSLFDFEAVRESGWSKEFDTLIRLISEAKNEGSESPMDLMTTDGQINFKVLNNLRTKTILNSTLLAKATVQLLLNAKAGKGFLSHLEDVIVIPKNLANKDAEDWLSYRYVCEKQDQVYKDNYGSGEVGDIISNAAYKAAVTAGKITADNWQREAYQGELYQAVDGLKQAITEMDIVSYKAFPSKPAEYVNLLSKVSDATIDSLASSTVLNASITKQILKLSNESGYEDFIVVPKEAVDYIDKGTADEYKMLKCDDGHNEMRAIIRSFQVLSTHIDISDMGNVGLDVLAELLNPYLVDDYVCKEAYGEYTLGQVLSVDDYNDLPSDDKDYWQARYPVDSYRCVNPAGGVIGSVITKEAYEALDEISKAYFKEVYKAYAYECVVPYGTYTEGHNITVEEFNDLAAAEKDNWQPLVTNLDRALNSRIFYCSLSKLLVKYGEDEDSVLQIPNSVINMKENADETGPAIKVITKLEIENTMKAIHDLDLTDNLENLKLDDINDKLNEPSADDTTRLVVDDVLNSKIIHCTLSKYLLDFVDKEDAVVTVPNTVKTLEADKDIITKEELRALVVATKRLNLNFNELENLNLTTLINTLNGADPINPAQKVSDTVLTSKIYHCTISKKLSDMATKEDSKLLLPEETSVMEGDIKAIQKPELVNLLEAIGVVDIDFENLNDLDYVELVNSMNDVAYPDSADTSTKLEVTLRSAIFHATFSDVIIDLDGDSITVPASVKDNDSYKAWGTVNVLVTLEKDELKALVKALADLDLSDDLKDLKLAEINDRLNEPSADDPTKLVVDDILTSKIMHCTLSKYLLDFTNKDEPIVTVPNTVKALEADKNVITKVELRALVVATKRLDLDFDELENLNLTTLVATLNAEDPIDPTKKVSDTVLDSAVYHCTISKKLSDMAKKEGSKLLLPEETSVMEGDIKAILKLELVNLFEAIGVVDIDFENLNDLDYIGLINSMNDVAYPETADTSTKLEVTLKSMIFHATLSDVIIDLDGKSITIPPSVKDSTIYTAWETLNVLDALEKGELKALVKALKVLGVVEEQEEGPSKVNTSINLITDLLDATEVQEDGTVAPNAPRRIDYIVGSVPKSITGSEIIRATISKFVIDESNLTAAEKSLVIVNDNRVLEKDGEVRLLKKEEFVNMVTSINSLGLVTEEGLSKNIGVSLINKMCIIPANKVPGDEGYDVRDYVFDKRPVDYITGYETNTGSWVLKATFSKYIIQQEQIVTPSVEVELFAATSETNDVPIIKKDELKSLIIGLGPDGIGAVGDDNKVRDVNDLMANTFDNKDEVSASRILTATITSKLTDTLKMERDAYDNEQQTKCDADGKVLAGPAIDIKVITGDEMKKFLVALELLGVSDFKTAKLSLSTLFNSLDEEYPGATGEENKKIDYLLKSRIVWHTMSEEIKGFKNEDGTALLVAPTYANRIVYFLDGEKSAYDSDIYDAYLVEPIVRFGTKELKAIIGAFRVIMGDTGDEFKVTDEAMKAIYKDDKRESVATAISESVLMTMNVKQLVTKAVESVFGANPYFSADTIKANIDNINNREWKSYVETEVLATYNKVDKAGRAQTYAYNDGANDYYDCQLVNLLNAINQFENFTANVGATEADTGRTLRTSLRALNNSNVTNGSLPKFFKTYWEPLFVNPAVALKYTDFDTCYNDVFERVYAETDLYTMAYIDAASLRHVNLNRYFTGLGGEFASLD